MPVDERLKLRKTVFGKDHFEKLLERIREIRASEGRFYKKIIDIYALSDVLDCEMRDLDGFIGASSKAIKA
jgi:hypothetical protein